MQENIIEGFRPSPQQQRLWSLARDGAALPARAACALLLEGDLDAGALHGALRLLVGRHEILRTSLQLPPGADAPVQVIADEATPRLDVRESAEGSADESDARLDLLLEEAAGGSADEPMGARLVKLSARRHLLLLDLPAPCADRRGLDNLSAELVRAYEAALAGSDLHGEPMQYADVAEVFVELLESEETRHGRRYWQEATPGAPARAGLPDEPETGAGGGPRVLRERLDAALAGRLERAARDAQAGAANFLLACWQLLLWRLTRLPEVTVAAVYTGRTYEGLEDAVGLFARYLPVTARPAAGRPFEELLREVDGVAAEAARWQEYFDWRFAGAAGGSDAESAEVTAWPFAFEYAPRPAPQTGGGLTFSVLRQRVYYERFRLQLTCLHGADGLELEFHYDPASHSAGTVGRLARQFRRLVEGALLDARAAVERLPLMDEAERRRLLARWGDARRFPAEETVVSMFEEQARRSPESVALVLGGEQLTYDELNERGNRLASHLRAQGVGPESRVAILLERSFELVVGLLGVLKAGGAYVPLDSRYPPERLSFMLEDSGAAVLLTQRSLLEKVGGAAPAHTLCLDGEWGDDSPGNTEDLAPLAGSDNLAYVIYTSGSTGRPKGVGVTHANVTRLFASTTELFNFDERDVWTLFHSSAFDFSVWEIWGALLYGGRLVVVPYEVSRSPDEFLRLIRREGVTVLNQTPSAFRQLMRADEGSGVVEDLPLRFVVFGGEALDVQGLRAWFGRRGDERPRLVNMYGITETTVHVTYRPLRAADVERGVSSAVGGPLPDLRLYLLDARMEPAPEATEGEIFVGGAGLARGYLGRPGLTAERFVPDPFSGEAGARLYRSGDVARADASGELEYVGRADQQVKVRGHRIELGEIEAAIASEESIGEAVVLAAEEEDGGTRLVAYVAGRGGASVEVGELRRRLREKLPEQMIPSAFVALDALPLTPHGKLDRRALLALAESGDQHEGPYDAPVTPVQEVVAGLFAELLGLERVGLGGNFFELGGHSLLATRLIWRVRRSFGVEVDLPLFFERPTVRELAQAVERELRAGSTQDSTDITRVGRDRPLPLSYAQQRLWFLDQLEPGGAAYNIPAAVRLEGPLDMDALGRAVNEVVRRHESLRTTFRFEGGEPAQVVAESLRLTLPVVDLSELARDEREAEAARVMAEEAARPFDLASGPLLRVRALRLAADEHLLMCTTHHIVSDGWSMGILIGEVTALYTAFSAGGSSPLPELGIQYADFAAWQRRLLDGEGLARQLSYWTRKLEGAAPALRLPTDRPRSSGQSSAGAARSRVLPPALVGALKSLARGEGATLFMTLLAAFKVLLYRYANQHDILVGTPVAGRDREETENLIGFFINTLVLRTDLSGGPSFRELLTRVRETALGAYAHQDVPFEKLVEELQPERSLSHTPFFQVMFTLQNAPRAALELPGVTASEVGVEGGATKFDLSLSASETDGRLLCALRYRADLFDEATVDRMLEHFERVLAGVAADPDLSVARVPLLAGEESRRLLREWNETRTDAPGEVCVHQLFEAQAEQGPEATALVYEDESLTYDELNRAANRLAHHLRRRGVGPEVRVGILSERSAAFVVAMLAVLKAGGAYVPLDREFPAERLAYMLEDSGAALLLLSSRGGAQAPPRCRAEVVPLDDLGELLAGEPAENPAGGATEANIAYVIYTSGSTGRPKGVAVEHRQLVNYLRGVCDALDLPAGGDYAVVSTPAADLGLTMVYPSLTRGGCLHVIARERVTDPEALARYFSRHPVDCLKIVPSHLAALLSGAEPARVLPRRRLVLGGEASTRAWVRELRRLAPDAEVFNHYGPTETTVGVLTYHVGDLAGDDRATVPLGRPLANTQIYLLDSLSQPVPVGVAGELYVGGRGLSRGYLNRPAATAERFVPDPFSPEPGGRLYRTGDLARYLPDGNVEFLGRADEQVKLRGHRVEPKEIEAVLGGHAGVREALVLVREDEPGDKRLVAYFVPEVEPAPGAAELRAHLGERLPEYMLPSAFVTLERVPVTPNGKLDRGALPAPAYAEAAAGGNRDGARTQVEEALEGIFAEVLRRESVGVRENFFAAGGHSLLATQLISRVRHVFKVELPLRALFESPTVEGLAARVESAAREGAGTLPPPIVPAAREGALPLSYAQQRLWFLDQLEPGTSTYNIPIVVRLSGRLDARALEESLNDVVARHEVLRTTFPSPGGEPRQEVADELRIEVPVLDLSQVADEERRAQAERLIAEEAGRPFDLARGPLLRARLLRLGPEEHVATLVMHHVVSDGWSRGILMRELSAFYGARLRGESSPLAGLPVQYADFAAWQREWLRGEVLEAQLDYWRGRLSGAEALELPTDRPRPPVRGLRGATLPFAISAESGAGLRRLSRQEGATLFMTLLTAFKLLLARYGGREDVVVGTPIAGRNRLETEGLIGFFVNMLAVRTDLSGGPSFREALARVREATLGAYAHQDVPFEKLVEELQPERDMSRHPLFQVSFTLENASGGGLELPGLSLRGEPSPGDTSKFDLTLMLEETGTGQLAGAFEYSTELFDEATVTHMVSHFEVLLKGVVADPDSPASGLSLLTEAEERLLLSEWGAGPADEYPRERCIHHLIEERARLTPDAPAVACEGVVLSYSELARRAERLADYLRARGVGPEVRVGLFVERSWEMPVGLLAILMAGGAYVPIDPSYPRERVSHIMSDARVAVLLTQERLAGALPAHGAAVVMLDGEWDAIERGPSVEPAAAVGPDNLAYVIYTSGSTGRPKGVPVTHRNLVHSTAARFSYYPEPVEGFLLLSSYAFDSSVAGIFWTLCQGGLLVVPRQETQHDPPYLFGLMREHAPSHLLCLPSLHALLLELGGAGELAALKAVIVAGEACTSALVAEHHELLPRVALYNEYGPTEGTVWSTVYRCEPRTAGAPVPIGRPVARVQVYLLDAALRPAPAGVPGELYIGGEGLSRGYLNQPGMTAEKFIPHPFSSEPGARLYRTGDLARYLPDGNVEFLGRADQQVKIRGYRIEPEEVGAVLAQCPGIREAAVIAAAERGGELRLVAYVAPEPGAEVEVGAVRAYLKDRLPDYMHPSAFVLLEELPLTPNGKLDRAALPEAGRGRARELADFVAPRTATEYAVAQIWEDLLGHSPVGVDDNFFDVGGHSLLAVRLMARLQQQFGQDIPLAALFRGATVAHLAELIGRNTPPAPRAPLVPIQPKGTKRPFFCVHAIGGEVLSFYHLARRLGDDQPFYGLQAPRLHEMGNEPETIAGSAAEYLRAVREVQPEGPYLLGGYSYGAIVAYEMAQQLEAAGERAALVAVLDTSSPGVMQQLPEDDQVELLQGLAWSTARQYEKYLMLSAEELRSRNPEERLQYFIEQMQEAGLAPGEVEIRMLRNFLAGHRSRQRAAREYRPRGASGAAITLFRCAEADAEMLEAMRRAGLPTDDPAKGWRAYTDGPLEVVEVPGHHNRMCEEPYVVGLAEAMARSLARACESTDS